MIRHVVMLSWNEKCTAEAIEAVSEGLAALPSQIQEIRSYQFGPDVQIDRRNADYVLIADFDNEEDYQTYVNHPAHVEFMANRTAPILESFRAARFEVH